MKDRLTDRNKEKIEAAGGGEREGREEAVYSLYAVLKDGNVRETLSDGFEEAGVKWEDPESSKSGELLRRRHLGTLGEIRT